MTDSPDRGLHIDSDWKSEAAAEKERLMAQEREEAVKETGSGGGETSPGFLELVNMVAMQAAVALGGYQGPGGEQIPPNQAAGKQFIDLLEVLAEKTKGNLSSDEEKVLSSVLHEMRMVYVQSVSGGGGGGGPTEPPQPEG